MAKRRQVKVVDYNRNVVPSDYKCDGCFILGVRLWREFQVGPTQTRLFCSSCAENDQKLEKAPGWKSFFKSGIEDRIGCFVPAIPEENANTYWGHFVVPIKALRWWKNLPLR